MAPNPDGVYNPDLWVLDIRATETDRRCIVVNYGCHPVIVYGFAWDGISADYPGVCRQQLKAQLGNTSTASSSRVWQATSVRAFWPTWTPSASPPRRMCSRRADHYQIVSARR